MNPTIRGVIGPEFLNQVPTLADSQEQGFAVNPKPPKPT